MSEEKLYAVRNDEGKYWDTGMPPWWDDNTGSVFKRIDLALSWAKKYDGHVVTLIEEPKKVVLTKEQAEIVDYAHGFYLPAFFISNKSSNEEEEEEELLMNAYVNGYTVEKEKKYNVKVPKRWSGDDKHYWTKEQDGALTWACLINKDYMIPAQQFTESEIEHYGLQDCEKEEVTDDDD